jgi:hypothetical protein
MAARIRTRLTTTLVSAWSGIVVAVVATALIVAAVVSPGFSVADVRLDNSAVYVVKSESRLVGMLNNSIDRLATSVRSADHSFRVLQSGDRVLLVSSSNQIQEIDFARGASSGSPVQLPAAAAVSLGADTLSIVNPTDGRMWTGDVSSILAIDFAQAPAQVDLGEGGLSVVTTGGQAIGLSLKDQTIVRLVDGEVQRTSLPWRIEAPYDVALSAVGNKAVVLDRGRQQVWIEGDSRALELPGGSTARLAPPTDAGIQGTEEARAVVATSAGLVGIGRDRLFSLVTGINAEPQTPLVVDECAYGAFANGRFAKLCSGGEPQLVDIPRFDATDVPVLRTNRGVVVLNSSRIGYVWMVNKDMLLITDWQDVTPSEANQGDNDDEHDTQVVPPDRETSNRAPVAVDDPKLAARAGRSTLLPVLDNDSDADGDIVTVSSVPKPNQGSLSLVRGGTGLQLQLPIEAKGTVTFSYTITDGRGGTDSATATVKVLPANQSTSNQPPVQKKKEPLLVALGSSTTKRVLLDWTDPDGDDLVLTGARMAEGNDEVDFTPDGMLNYRDVGTQAGRKEIEVTVSDGLAESTGVVVIDARKGSDIQPVANGDYYSTTVNQEIVLDPLTNDVGGSLKLARVVRESNDFKAEPNYQENTIRFSAPKAGTYYLRYFVTNGYPATGIARIDVIEPVSQNRAPVAARDVALLPDGGSVLVDPLLNDEDADGDVLVLQSVTTHPSLTIEMEQRHLLRISAITRPKEPISLSYRVSDGVNSVTGTIVVIPAPSTGKTTPVAMSDEITVRAGDTTTINVLRNDYSPIGLDLTVAPQLVESPGIAWVDGESVRFTAPATAGQYRAVYRITDELGQESSAQVRFNVVASDVENSAPKPELVIGRVLANSVTKIPIPLEGIDPNGDSVRLLGLDSGPTRGRIMSVGERWIEYQSYDETGTDAFTYQVTDSRGAIGVGTIRIGIVPRESELNSSPVAEPDAITARPGRTVRIPVLGNDSDPDGDAISLKADELDFDFPVEVVDDTDLVFTMPDEPGTYTGTYTITDARGRSASGVVTVVSDPAAPLLPPTARDDQVLASDVVGKTAVDVPVLDNDFDRDGPKEDLTVSIPGGNTDTVSVPKGTTQQVVRVTVGATMQLVRYEITDADGMKNWAVVVVPGAADLVPSLKADAPPLQVVSGETLSIAIGDYVVGTAGRAVSLVSEDRIWQTSRGHVTAAGPRTIEFAARDNYAGPASAVFEVTDGRNGSDESGRKAVISLPITIVARTAADQAGDSDTSRLNSPPVVSNPVTIDVGQGEPEKSMDLAQYVSDPDGDSISFGSFRPESDAAGLRVSFSSDETMVVVSADYSALAGSKETWTGVVTDGRNAQTSMSITFVVSESTRPRPTVVNDEAVGDQGRPSDIKALANDRSNLVGDLTLTIVGAELASGRGSVNHTADSVTITPADDFVGELRVRYTVQDATKSASRQVDGFITVTVRGRPSQPGVVVLDTVGNGRLDVHWTGSTPNGHPIQRYEVTARSSGHTVTQECATTTCAVTGLRNGVKYTLTVVAINALGASQASAASAEMTPDVKPAAPGAPQLTAGDEKITATWGAPSNEGTPITMYTLELTGPSSVIVVLREGQSGFSTRSHEFTNLQNGSQYSVRVLATNEAGDGPYGPSASEVPAAPPSVPLSVTATDNPAADEGKSAVVTWAAPASNGGAAIEEYIIYVNGSKHSSVGGGTTSSTIALASNGEITVAVSARNKAGEGPRSNGVTTVVYGAPTRLTSANIERGNGYLRLTTLKVESNGKDPDNVSLIVRQGSATVANVNNVTVPWDFTTGTPGSKYTFLVQACVGSKCSSPIGGNDEYEFAAAPGAPSLVVGGVIDENTVRWRATHTEVTNASGTPIVLWANGYKQGQMLGQPYTGPATAPKKVTAFTESAEGWRSNEVSVEVKVPMSPLALDENKKGFVFTVNHQPGSSLSCAVKPPTGPDQPLTVSIGEGGAGAAHFTSADPLAVGDWLVTCGPMTRTLKVT